MADLDDIYGAGTQGGEALTFIETADDVLLNGATQDSQYHDYRQDFGQSQMPDASVMDGTEPDLRFREEEDEGEKAEGFPEHACRYCGINEPAYVAQCTICNKWFCNGKVGTTGAHLIQHMVRSQHKELCLHADSALGETQLECYQCGAKNVFLLGYIPAKADSLVVILCRSPCAQQASTEADWSGEDWNPLVQERQLLSWIVQIPPLQLQNRARQLKASQIVKLEDVWKDDPNAALEDIEKGGMSSDLEHVQLAYQDAFQYRRIFSLLIQEEADFDRRMKESQTQSVGHVRWDIGLNKKHIAYFKLPKFQEGSMKLMIGDELKLKHTQTVGGTAWEKIGQVFKIPDNHSDEIGLEMRAGSSEKMPSDLRINYTCEVVWNATSFARQNAALNLLQNDESCVSPYIFYKLMGRDVEEIQFKVKMPHRLSAPGLPDLNPSQIAAVRMVLSRPLSLIQGPPGTGKTVTSATIVYHLVRQTNGQVLVCAPSNVAVDQLAEKIHNTGLKVVRVCAVSRESLGSNVEFLTLHKQLANVRSSAELTKLQQLKDEMGGLNETDLKRYLQLRKVQESEMLMAADVICCTASTAADMRISRLRIKCVLIDESTQATEPEVLIPIVRGVRQLILVGDHCQLGPVVLCKKAAKAGLSQSLFERLVMLGNRPIRLQVQYRMHPVLSAFPSNVFYEGSLQNGVTEAERTLHNVDWTWPVPDRPMMFWSCYGKEEMSTSGTSFLNRAEAANVEKIASRLIRGGMRPSQIGVVTPYEGQRAYIVQYMQSQGTLSSKLLMDLEIANVDAFQGREKDVIIVTCVRSNENSGIGFLNDPRRLNVAITRAKYGLVVIGNAKVLARQAMWHDLLSTFMERGLVVEGPLNNLTRSPLVLPKRREDIPPMQSAHRPERMQYTLSEYRHRPGGEGMAGRGGGGGGRGGFYGGGGPGYDPYIDPANAITPHTLTQSAMNLPVPLHMLQTVQPPVYSDRRAGAAWPPNAHNAGGSRMGGKSKRYSSGATSQASQMHVGGARGFTLTQDDNPSGLSGWSQSQQDYYGGGAGASQSQLSQMGGGGGRMGGGARGGPASQLFSQAQDFTSDAVASQALYSQDMDREMTNLMLSQGP